MNKNLKTILFIFFIALILLFLSKPKESSPEIQPTPSPITYSYDIPLSVADKEILVEIADEAQEIMTGLSGRPNLEEGKGMLFIFSPPQQVNFWMPDMHFPIDIIFIRENKIIAIEKDVPNPPLDTPRPNLPTYSPDQEVDMVLEVPAGWSEKNDIQVGDEINL